MEGCYLPPTLIALFEKQSQLPNAYYDYIIITMQLQLGAAQDNYNIGNAFKYS